jgi:hypothetical protein
MKTKEKPLKSIPKDGATKATKNFREILNSPLSKKFFDIIEEAASKDKTSERKRSAKQNEVDL